MSGHWVTYPNDPAGYAMGWTRAHWIPTIQRFVCFAGDSHGGSGVGTNSLRALDPVTKAWTILYPNNRSTAGVWNRDNHPQIYVPNRDELWVFRSSTAQYGGRWHFPSAQWVGVGMTQAEFAAGLIQSFTMRVLENPANGWVPRTNTGVIFGGNVEGNETGTTRLIEPNPSGSEPYRYWEGVLPGPSKRANIQNQGVGIGAYFYLYGGSMMDGVTKHRDLWRFHVPTRIWTRLADNSTGKCIGGFVLLDFAPPKYLIAVAGRNAVRYDLERDAWQDLDPPYVGTEAWRVRNSAGAWCPPVGEVIMRWGTQDAKVEGYAPEFGVATVSIIQGLTVRSTP